MRHQFQFSPMSHAARRTRLAGNRLRICPDIPARSADRSGFSILELMIAGLLVGAIASVAVPTLRWVALERRSADRRQLAMLEASNQLEQITLHPWNELTPEFVAQLKLSETTAQELPQGDLQVSLEPGREEIESKRVVVQVKWQDRDSSTGSTVQLAAWVFRQPEGN